MYRYLLSQLQVIGHPKIYCLTTWDEHAHGIPYDEVIKRSCALVRGTPVDISKIPGPGMAGPAERLTQFGKADGWHPNDAGHAAIANKILQVF
jgi:hypothetical protein